jgi:DNA-binding transcriptional ArsR family regulator
VREAAALEFGHGTEVPEPETEWRPDALDLATVLHALSDPVRLLIVSQLAAGGELCCGEFDVPITKSTCSHHFRVLREAGVISQRIEGKRRLNVLCRDALDGCFPGLLDAVLRA